MQQVSSIAACTLLYIQRQEEFETHPGMGKIHRDYFVINDQMELSCGHYAHREALEIRSWSFLIL